MQNLRLPGPWPRRLFAAQALCIACTCGLSAQDATGTSANDGRESVVELSPFEVNTSKDVGYLATNTISGTRLNTLIKDLPMPVEVITEEFLRDTGANDLRESLRYSSGIILQSQNDYGGSGGSNSSSPGKVNNPEGETSSAYQTTVKIRGFQTDSVLRDGFRRRNSTDSVNISRIEVVRGPASLLYGVGNFGGVVNYFVKRPTGEQGLEITSAVGSYGLFRSTLDATTPITEDAGIRFTAAYEQQGDYTDFNDSDHFFLSPVAVYRPFKGTEILLDYEYGEEHRNGISWRRLRSVASNFINWDGGEAGSFLNPEGTDPKSFRWSGPDTYNKSQAQNIEAKITQRITDNLYVLVGYNRALFDYDQLDNMASLELATSRSNAPAWAVGTVDFTAISPDVAGVVTGPNEAVIPYQWELRYEENETEQVRAEINYSRDLFADSSHSWLKIRNSLLLGYSDTTEDREIHTRQTPNDAANFHNPTDGSYIRFGQMTYQGDAVAADVPMVEQNNSYNETKNPAYYAVYQGNFLDDRITGILGIRRDSNESYKWQYNPQYNANGTVGGDSAPSEQTSDRTWQTTNQYGISVRVIDAFSVYAMRSEGVQPNFNGYVDFNGVPIAASVATNKEVGFKFDFLGGKISGAVGFFEITRERAAIGDPSKFWFAPTWTDHNYFDPNSDIVYQVNDFNPATNDWNPAVTNAEAEWNAGVDSGAIYQATNASGQTNWYLNASTPEGAALMDAVFANAYTYDVTSWFGWPYNQDSLTNNATLDYNGASPAGPTGGQSVALGSDQSKGWDAQVILSPTEDLQLVLSWAHTEREVLNGGSWIEYPYPEDRWAVWYNPAWGLQGMTREEAFTDWTDTSSIRVAGTGLALDDTPKNQGSFWVHYQIPQNTQFEGLSFGLGGTYEGPREYFSGITRGGGSVITDGEGNILILKTEDRFQLDGMIKYEFGIRGHYASLQLNVNNVLDDQKLYGMIYQAPRTWRLEFDYRF